MKPTGATKEAMGQRYGWSVITGRYKIYDSKLEQIATADGREEAQLIIDALNERERLREALRQVRAASNHRSLEMVGSLVIGLIPLIDAALNEAEG